MPWVESLLNDDLRIMFYRFVFNVKTLRIKYFNLYFISGNLDFIVAYPLSQNAFIHMDWKGKEEYKQAKRQAFVVDKKVAGYFYYLFHQIYYIFLTI